MKVLIVIKKWLGGVGRYVKEVEKVLEEQGHEVEVISREDDLELYSLKDSIIPLRKEVQRKDYDLLFTHDWSIALPFLDFNDHITIFHGIQSQPTHYLQRFVGGWMGENLIVVSERVKNIYPEATLAPEGVDLEQFKPLNDGGRRKAVGFPSNPEPNYKFFEIKDAVEETDYPMYVVRNLDHEKMNEFYNSVETVVSLPPETAGFNLVWLEAMAAGCKVVGTRKAGVGGKLPITYVEDYDSISQAIENAENPDVDYRDWIRRNGYTWSDHVEKLLEKFRDEKTGGK